MNYELKKTKDIFTEYVESQEENKTHIEKLLYNCFENGITWFDFANLEITTKNNLVEKKPLQDLNIFLLRKLIEPIFNEFFIQNLLNSKEEEKDTYLKLGVKAFSCDYFKESHKEKFKIFWDYFDLTNNKKNLNQLLINVSSLKQLNLLENEYNIDPLTIIDKNNNIKSFLLTNACQREIYSPKNWCEKSHSILLLQKQFINFSQRIKEIDDIDLKTRIAYTFSFVNDESKFNKFLNNLNIKKVNLDCKDYLFLQKNIKTFQEKLIENSKIKTLNKFNNSEKVLDIAEIICTNPKKPELISNKKTFLKNWLKNKKENDIDLTNILCKVVSSQFKKTKFSTLNVKCYFPIKFKNLDKEDSYWKEAINGGYTDLNFLPLNFGCSYESFYNLVKYVGLHKDNINWEKPLNDKNENELGFEFFKLLLKIPTIYSLNNVKEIDIENLENIFIKLKDDTKIKLLKDIDVNWNLYMNEEKELLNLFDKKNKELNSSFFLILGMIIDKCIQTNQCLTFINKDKIINDLNKFEGDLIDVDKVKTQISYIDLTSSIKKEENKDVKHNIRKRKI